MSFVTRPWVRSSETNDEICQIRGRRDRWDKKLTVAAVRTASETLYDLYVLPIVLRAIVQKTNTD